LKQGPVIAAFCVVRAWGRLKKDEKKGDSEETEEMEG
jgi:hypothetical protein